MIPNQVKLELTLRSYSDEVRMALIDKIKRVCKGVAISAGLTEDQFPTVFVRDEHCPSLYNNPELAERMIQSFKKVIPEENVLKVPSVMGGEDFSEFGRTSHKVPVSLFWLGAVEPSVVAEAKAKGETLPSLHSSKFAPDYPKTIETGVVAMTQGVLDLLQSTK